MLGDVCDSQSANSRITAVVLPSPSGRGRRDSLIEAGAPGEGRGARARAKRKRDSAQPQGIGRGLKKSLVKNLYPHPTLSQRERVILPLLCFVSRITGWFLLLEVFPTTLSLPQKGDQVREVLPGQRVLVGGHVGTAAFDLRCNSLIVYRLSRYQSGSFIEISQGRGGCSGCSRVVIVADPALIKVNLFSALGAALGKPLKVKNLCRTLETALRRVGRRAGRRAGCRAPTGVLQTEHQDQSQYRCVLHRLLQR